VPRVGEVEKGPGPAVPAGASLADDLRDGGAPGKGDGGALGNFPGAGSPVDGFGEFERGADFELDGRFFGETRELDGMQGVLADLWGDGDE
jgi:hypothetical protein